MSSAREDVVKLESLRLAIQFHYYHPKANHNDVVKAAAIFYDYLKGVQDE